MDTQFNGRLIKVPKVVMPTNYKTLSTGLTKSLMSPQENGTEGGHWTVNYTGTQSFITTLT